MKVQITVQIDEELFIQIKQEAKDQDRTIAAQVRRILKDYYSDKAVLDE